MIEISFYSVNIRVLKPDFNTTRLGMYPNDIFKLHRGKFLSERGVDIVRRAVGFCWESADYHLFAMYRGYDRNAGEFKFQIGVDMTDNGRKMMLEKMEEMDKCFGADYEEAALEMTTFEWIE